ncbi:MAG: VWA domain-containing protein [Treponema sp.]|nr:VWA domain-containing protein [Treponema sp.]
MSLNDAVEAIPRKSIVLFFLIDTSGSMGGSKIGAVNAAIEEVIPELKDISMVNADAEVKVAALEFNDTANWITGNSPIPVDNFLWRYVDAFGKTVMGEAFRKLNDALSTKTFMQDAVGSFAPAIFLLSDGEPTDEFANELAELKQNKWFNAAIKVAVAIGDDANKDHLAEFTGSMESILEVHSAAMLRKTIKFVSIRASQVASKSVQVSAMKPAAASPVSANSSPAGGDDAGNPALPVKQAALNEQLTQIKATAAVSGDDEW